MEIFSLLPTISPFPTMLTVSVNETSTTAKMIQDYGITTVLCAIVIIFSIFMFNNIIHRSNKTDETVVKLLNEIKSTVNTIKNSDVDVAGSFDKHNTKFVIEMEHLKGEVKSIEEKLDDMAHDDIESLRKILVVIDQECSDTRDYIFKIEENTKEIRATINSLQKEIEKIKK